MLDNAHGSCKSSQKQEVSVSPQSFIIIIFLKTVTMTSGRNYQRQETSQKMKAELSTLLNFIWKEGVVVEGKEDPYLVGLFPKKKMEE